MRVMGRADNHVVQLNAFGLSNLTLATRPLTQLKPGEIRIRVRAVSLNYHDLLIARGQLLHHVGDITLPRSSNNLPIRSAPLSVRCATRSMLFFFSSTCTRSNKPWSMMAACSPGYQLPP